MAARLIDADDFNRRNTWERYIRGGDEENILPQLMESMRRFPAPGGHSIRVV
jgi:hypothetical protein